MLGATPGYTNLNVCQTNLKVPLQHTPTRCQVDLEVAILEALPILFAAEAEEEGSEAREEAEEMAMERVGSTVLH